MLRVSAAHLFVVLLSTPYSPVILGFRATPEDDAVAPVPEDASSDQANSSMAETNSSQWPGDMNGDGIPDQYQMGGMHPGGMQMGGGMYPGMGGMRPGDMNGDGIPDQYQMGGMQPGGMYPGMGGMQPGGMPGMGGMRPGGMYPGMGGMRPGDMNGDGIPDHMQMGGMQPGGMYPGMGGMHPGMGGMQMGGMRPGGMHPGMDMNGNGIPDGVERNVCGWCMMCPRGSHDEGKCKPNFEACKYNGFFGEMMEHADDSCPGPA